MQEELLDNCKGLAGSSMIVLKCLFWAAYKDNQRYELLTGMYHALLVVVAVGIPSTWHTVGIKHIFSR